MSEEFQQEIDYLVKELDWTVKDAFLAGGAITSVFTNKKIRDFDLYFKSKDAFTAALQKAFDSSGFWCVALTDRAVTFSRNNEKIYQLMCFDWFASADAIFSKFDFTTCMAAIDIESKDLFRHPDFIRDTSKRVLRFNHGTQFPIGSALRLQKYKARGYSIEDVEFLKVILACAFRSPKSWEDLKSQLGGQYGEAVSLDTSQEFTLENAIRSLTTTLIEKPKIKEESAESFDSAMNKIFGLPSLAKEEA